MDVERIQKINSMAVELLSKGMAKDREDAVIQAEKFFKNLNSDSLQPVSREGVAESRVMEQKSASVTQQAALSSDKMQDILEKNSQFLVKTIKEFQEKMQAMEGEINSLKQRVLMSRPAESVLSAPSSSPAKPAAASTSGTSAGSSSQSHPRTGSYKQEEVSIEKYFYMGGKK